MWPALQIAVEATLPATQDVIIWTPHSGAETMVMGLNTATSFEIQLSYLTPANGEGLHAAGDHPLTCLGTFKSQLELATGRQ